MKQTAFYHESLGRANALITAALSFFFSITSYPRLFLEVWVRRRFGTGYFALSPVIVIVLGLLITPIIKAYASLYFEWFEFFKHYTTWYIYTLAFAYKCWNHHKEIALKPGEFDFSKFGRYSGDKDGRFYLLYEYGVNVNPRSISIFLEPLLFFIIGLFLTILAQPIGLLILGCSILYSLGYSGAYHIGDIYLQEIIDKMIVSKELSDTCMKGIYPSSDKGFEHFSMPQNSDHLRQLASFVTEKGEFADVK